MQTGSGLSVSTDQGLGPVDASSGSATGGPVGGPSGALETTAGSASAGPGPARPQGSSSGTTPAPLPGRTSPPGVTTPLSIGFVVQANSSELAKSVGADNLQNGDERATVEALVQDLNARGGIQGRRIVPVIYEYDPASDSDLSVIQQEACAAFTEDNRVVAALLGWHDFSDHALETCLQRKGVVTVNSAGILTGDEALLRRLPDYIAPPGVSLGRQAASYADSLARQGFFTKGTRVGVLVLDQPDYRGALEGSLVPALRRHGVTQLEKAFYPPLRTTADVSSQSAAISSTVLRFKSLGIDRVLFLQLGVNGPLFFMQSAESQDYRPRYALSTTDAPTALVPLVPAAQLQGSVGMGWMPVIDVPAAQDAPSAPARKTCLDLIRKKTGETFANRTIEYVALSFCDSVMFFAHVARQATAVDQPSLRDAVARVGTSYQSPLVLRSAFGPARRDGAASSRDLAYTSSCTCFAYSGPVRPLS